MTDSTETTRPERAPSASTRIRMLVIGAMTAAALAVPTMSAVSVSAHAAGKAPVVKPASHRLA